MVLPQEAMMGLLPQLLGKLKPGPAMGAAFPGQVPPQPMAPPPPGMQMPPPGHVAGGTMGLPPNPFAEADAAAAAGGAPYTPPPRPDITPETLPPIPPLQPPQPPQMPSQDPFAIPQGPPSPIDIQQMPHTPSPPSALERVQGMPDPLQPHGGTGPGFGGPTPTLQGLRQDAMKSPPPRTPQSPYNPGRRLNPSPPTRQQRVEQANRPFPL